MKEIQKEFKTIEGKDIQSMSHEELIGLIVILIKQNQELRQENEQLKREISKLKKDSSNSSKPPSSDIHKPKKTESLRKKSGKKPGGQKGQKREGISQTENPDTVIRCEQELCGKCGESLNGVEGNIISKRQEKDIPPIRVIVTEYQQIEKTCTCGYTNTGDYPEHINAPIQIGENAKSLVIYLNTAHHMPYKRLTDIARDLFQFPISQGSIENILNQTREKAAPIYADIMEMIKKGKWAGSDETGMKVDKKNHWLWVWQNFLGSFYSIEKGRGYEVVKRNFGEDYQGVLVHDCWSAQNNTHAKTGHQQCHPHLQRNLEFLIKTYKSKWAYYLNKLLASSQRARDQIWEENFDPDLRKIIISQYNKKLEELISVSLSEKDEITLQKRFKKHQEEILFFMQFPDIPFHNNSSERAVRQAKVKQKVSGCFRSIHGAERYAMLLSIIETAKKHGKNILDSIKQLMDGSLVFHEFALE